MAKDDAAFPVAASSVLNCVGTPNWDTIQNSVIDSVCVVASSDERPNQFHCQMVVGAGREPASLLTCSAARTTASCGMLISNPLALCKGIEPHHYCPQRFVDSSSYHGRACLAAAWLLNM